MLFQMHGIMVYFDAMIVDIDFEQNKNPSNLKQINKTDAKIKILSEYQNHHNNEFFHIGCDKL